MSEWIAFDRDAFMALDLYDPHIPEDILRAVEARAGSTVAFALAVCRRLAGPLDDTPDVLALPLDDRDTLRVVFDAILAEWADLERIVTE